MLSPQLAFEANNIYRALDQLSTVRRKRGRQALIDQALLAARRALRELQREPLITRTAAYVDETLARHDLNGWAVIEELRVDRETLRWFIEAECDLMRTGGFDRALIDLVERDMLAVLARPLTELPESIEEGFQQMIIRVEAGIERMHAEGERSEMFRDLAAVLGILSGCGVVAVDTAAAASTVGVLSPVLAASVPVGAEMLNRAISEVLDD